jgi:hypothetical protein
MQSAVFGYLLYHSANAFGETLGTRTSRLPVRLTLRAIHYMIVRIKLGQGRAPRKTQGKNRHLALALGALLIPAALMAYVLGFWRLASDIGVTREFAIGGLFSHWQIWTFMAATLHIAATVLNRYGRGGEFHLPRALKIHFGATASHPGDATGSAVSSQDRPRAKASRAS